MDINVRLGNIDNGFYEDCSKTRYEVSILICTFNPDYERLKYAINSALLQEDVSLQIVISDDGSKDFSFEQIVDYFETKNFHDFIISHLPENQGTVKNFRNGLLYCKGEFIRGLTPEDYIYGCDTIRKWVDFSLKHNVAVSFSNVICYKFENKNIVPVCRKANPQIISNYYKGSWEYNYLVFDDGCVGTGILVKREVAIRYIELIADKIVYCEDSIYRLMAMKRETMSFYNQPTVLYEVGNGMSTSNSDLWSYRLRKDKSCADDIMLDWVDSKDRKDRLDIFFKRATKRRKIKNRILRKLIYVSLPGIVEYKFRTHFHPRYTEMRIDKEYVNKLMHY